MEELLINPTSVTPRVHFDNARGYFELSGMSLPEDSFNFYKPLVEWLSNYVNRPAAETVLVFKMEYFNTSSTAYILKIIKEVGKMKTGQATVKWYHDFDDDDMSEAGKGLGMLANIQIQIIGYQSPE